MRMRRLSSAMPAALLATAALGAEPLRFELDNGLSVILRPVEDATTVASVVVFDVGELHDPQGKSGLGHLVEHVYVTAAAGDTPGSTADAWMQRYNHMCNAQTGRDYTVIATVFPATRLDAELAETAARLGDLRIEGADLDREKPRMHKELDNMYGGIPTLAAINLAGDRAVPLASGARKGGVIEQIDRMTVDDVRHHYASYYKPANATLVLVGPVDAGTRTRVEQLFGGIDRGRKLPTPRLSAKPQQGSAPRVAVPHPTFGRFPDGVAAICYALPEPGSDDFAAYLVLAGRIFDKSRPAIFAARQRQSPITPLTWAPLDRPEAIFFSAEIEPGESDEEAIAGLRATVARLAEIPEDENVDPGVFAVNFGPMFGLLELRDRDIAMNPYMVAFSLGRMKQLGLDAATLRAAIDAVTTDDLQRCARRYFGPNDGAAVVIRVE